MPNEVDVLFGLAGRILTSYFPRIIKSLHRKHYDFQVNVTFLNVIMRCLFLFLHTGMCTEIP